MFEPRVWKRCAAHLTVCPYGARAFKGLCSQKRKGALNFLAEWKEKHFQFSVCCSTQESKLDACKEPFFYREQEKGRLTWVLQFEPTWSHEFLTNQETFQAGRVGTEDGTKRSAREILGQFREPSLTDTKHEDRGLKCGAKLFIENCNKAKQALGQPLQQCPLSVPYGILRFHRNTRLPGLVPAGWLSVAPPQKRSNGRVPKGQFGRSKQSLEPCFPSGHRTALWRPLARTEKPPFPSDVKETNERGTFSFSPDFGCGTDGRVFGETRCCVGLGFTPTL